MRFALQSVLSIVLGFFLMGPLAGLFEAMRWPMFHGWALAHGSFVIAWPALTIVSFVALSLIPWFRRNVRDDLAVGASALVGAGILATMDWPGKGGPRAPFYLLAFAFAASVALAALARRTWLVPVAMAVPLLLNDSIVLVLGGSFARDYFTSEMTRTTIPIVINSLMGCVAVVIIRRLSRKFEPAQER
jgi:hypothetical protein